MAARPLPPSQGPGSRPNPQPNPCPDGGPPQPKPPLSLKFGHPWHAKCESAPILLNPRGSAHLPGHAGICPRGPRGRAHAKSARVWPPRAGQGGSTPNKAILSESMRIFANPAGACKTARLVNDLRESRPISAILGESARACPNLREPKPRGSGPALPKSARASATPGEPKRIHPNLCESDLISADLCEATRACPNLRSGPRGPGPRKRNPLEFGRLGGPTRIYTKQSDASRIYANLHESTALRVPMANRPESVRIYSNPRPG
jgi:hypothetical protein